MCKAVNNPENIGICLDTGHLNVAQKGNQYDFIMQAGNWLKALHIHDTEVLITDLKVYLVIGILCHLPAEI